MPDLWENRYTARTAGGHHLNLHRVFRCAVCKRRSVGGNKLALYCSPECRRHAAWRRKKGRAYADRLLSCLVCGKSLRHRKRNAMYCGTSCAQKAYRRKREFDGLHL